MAVFSETDRIFFSDGYRLASHALLKGKSWNTLENMYSTLYEQTDLLTDSFIRRCRAEGKRVDCHRGCSWCCHQAIFVSAGEILFLENYLLKHTDGQTVREVTGKTREKSRLTSKMNIREVLRHSSPCPLLQENCCVVYPVRPLACRIYLSSSEPSCRRQYRNPQNTGGFPELYAFPLRAGRMMHEGMNARLREEGIINTEWLLESMLTDILTNPAIKPAWISGKEVFYSPVLEEEERKLLNNRNHA